MTTREEWIAGARPKTLPAAIAPVLVGTAFAGYNANAVNFFLALIVGVALQVGVNYANDYSDGIKGTDKDRVGPMRLVGSGAATPEAVKRAALMAIAIAAIAGVSLAARSSWILIALGALSIIAAWTYTGGPKPYGYFALGEVSVFIFFGLVATLGTYFAHVGSLSFEVLLASFAMGCLACAILVLNNLRDLEKDKLAGKITLAVKIGHSQTRRFYQGLVFTPLLIALALVPTSFYFLLAFLALPQILKVTASIRTGASGSALIELLERTGKIQIIYSLAISLASLLYAR
ncbi:MAG: 1,4-dihydroxy-2-naphthoate polyprenyltransferase [Actinobacteria bacterium]|nr:1,4-dihydroxy-2-naphthoate polyprenyltransferase [Actinomycetota bacterium]